MAEPAGAAVPAISPGDDSERLGASFDRAIGEVYPYLFRRCGHDRSAAEDLTQETFATAVEALRGGRLEQITVGWLDHALNAGRGSLYRASNVPRSTR